MGKLDVTFMVKDKKGTYGRPIPRDSLVSYFKKTGPRDGEYGPFIIMLDLEAIPKDRRYLQLTVDFNEHKTVGGDPVIRLSQLGNPQGLIPQDAHTAEPGSWPFEHWRKGGIKYAIPALIAEAEDNVGTGRSLGPDGSTPGSVDCSNGDTPTRG